MNVLTRISIVGWVIGFSGASYASPYAQQLCDDPNYQCYEAEAGDTWESLFPDHVERDLMKRLNRVNLQLREGVVYAVPNDLSSLTKLEVAPFPLSRNTGGKKTIVVDQAALAWGAYSENGNLINWGPASSGRGYCHDTGRACHTISGSFTVYNKGSVNCKSSLFPVGKGGAEMPYCMFFKDGFALHGSNSVPGYNASHGCVRLFKEDARWLNRDFIELNHTRIIVEKLEPL